MILKMVHGRLEMNLSWRKEKEGSQVVSDEFWEFGSNVAAEGPPKPVKL